MLVHELTEYRNVRHGPVTHNERDYGRRIPR